MRIANLTHGALFMLGAYLGVSILKLVPNLWLAALLAASRWPLGGLLERSSCASSPAISSPGAGDARFAYIIADCAWSSGAGTRSRSRRRNSCSSRCAWRIRFSAYRVAVVVLSVLVGIALYLLMERTRLGG